MVADPEGRLRFEVDLGHSHSVQQPGFDAVDVADWAATTVMVTPY